MKRLGRIMVSTLMTALLALVVTSLAQAEVKIGVLAKRGAPEAMKQWGPTGAYLSGKIGETVTIVPLPFTEIGPAVQKGQIDFLLANSAFYVALEMKNQAKAVATLINTVDGKPLKEFGGVIMVRRESPIKTLADLKGKKFMCVKFSSFGGAHMAWQLLLQNGIDPQKDFAALLEGSKHDNVVLAVLNGTVDAGTVRSDTLERMNAEGKIKMSDFRVINQVKDDFPFVHSTRLFPEWPMAALTGTDQALSAKVAAALTAMPADSQAAQAAKIIGWSAPLDYRSVTECLQATKYDFSLGE